MNGFIFVFFGISWLVAPIVVMLIAGDYAGKSIVPFTTLFAKIIPVTVGSFLIPFIFIARKIDWSEEFAILGLWSVLFVGQSIYFFISLFYTIHLNNKFNNIRTEPEQLESKLVSLDDNKQMFGIIFFGLALIFTISLIVLICFPLIRGE